MDQNQQFQNDSVFSTPPIKNAAYYRAKAREALKPCYWNAFLVSAIAGLLGGSAAGGGFSFSFDPSSFNTEETADIMQQLEAGNLSSILTEIPFWPILVGVFGFALVFSVMFSLLVSSPVILGFQRYNLNVIDGKGNDNPLNVLFSYFKRGYGKSVGLHALYSLISLLTVLPMLFGMGFVVYALLRTTAAPDHNAYIGLMILSVMVFLATSVLSVVLSILVQYRYVFCFMILAEYPEMRVIDALRNSASLMKGNKWRLFCLQFSFVGWVLLAAFCTCGIGVLFLAPYMSAADAAFYDDIANRAAARETEFPSLDPEDYNPNEQDWWTQNS